MRTRPFPLFTYERKTRKYGEINLLYVGFGFPAGVRCAEIGKCRVQRRAAVSDDQVRPWEPGRGCVRERRVYRASAAPDVRAAQWKQHAEIRRVPLVAIKLHVKVKLGLWDSRLPISAVRVFGVMPNRASIRLRSDIDRREIAVAIFESPRLSDVAEDLGGGDDGRGGWRGARSYVPAPNKQGQKKYENRAFHVCGV